MLTAFLCLGLTAAPPSPQDSGSPWPSQRPTEGTTPAEWVQELESALRSHDDRLAVDAMVRLSGASHDLRDTDLGKTAARAVEKVLQQRRPEDQESLYVVALQTLAQLGPDGEKAALKALRSSNVTGRPAVLGAALQAVATSADERNLEVLFGYLTHDEAVVSTAAVEALACYEFSKAACRKEIVKRLTRTYGDLVAATQTPPRLRVQGAAGNRTSFARLEAMSTPLEECLRTLTGESHRGAPEWAEWFRDHENEPWPERDPPAGSGS